MRRGFALLSIWCLLTTASCRDQGQSSSSDVTQLDEVLRLYESSSSADRATALTMAKNLGDKLTPQCQRELDKATAERRQLSLLIILSEIRSEKAINCIIGFCDRCNEERLRAVPVSLLAKVGSEPNGIPPQLMRRIRRVFLDELNRSPTPAVVDYVSDLRVYEAAPILRRIRKSANPLLAARAADALWVFADKDEPKAKAGIGRAQTALNLSPASPGETFERAQFWSGADGSTGIVCVTKSDHGERKAVEIGKNGEQRLLFALEPDDRLVGGFGLDGSITGVLVRRGAMTDSLRLICFDSAGRMKWSEMLGSIGCGAKVCNAGNEIHVIASRGDGSTGTLACLDQRGRTIWTVPIECGNVHVSGCNSNTVLLALAGDLLTLLDGDRSTHTKQWLTNDMLWCALICDARCDPLVAVYGKSSANTLTLALGPPAAAPQWTRALDQPIDWLLGLSNCSQGFLVSIQRQWGISAWDRNGNVVLRTCVPLAGERELAKGADACLDPANGHMHVLMYGPRHLLLVDAIPETPNLGTGANR